MRKHRNDTELNNIQLSLFQTSPYQVQVQTSVQNTPVSKAPRNTDAKVNYSLQKPAADKPEMFVMSLMTQNDGITQKSAPSTKAAPVEEKPIIVASSENAASIALSKEEEAAALKKAIDDMYNEDNNYESYSDRLRNDL